MWGLAEDMRRRRGSGGKKRRGKRASLAVVNQIRCFSAAGLGITYTAFHISIAPWPQRRKTESFTTIGLRYSGL